MHSLEVLKSLAGKASRPEWTTIVLVFRLPKMLTAAMAEAGLSVAGLILSYFSQSFGSTGLSRHWAGASIGVAVLMFAGESLGALGAGAKGIGTQGSAPWEICRPLDIRSL